jgi:phosphate starvation-inducible PhoH-like protein
MTKRALKRTMRESEFDSARPHDEDNIRRLPVNRGWSPLPDGEREQGYLKTIKPQSRARPS